MSGVLFDPESIRTLAAILRETALTEIELVEGDRRIRLVRSGSAGQGGAASPPPVHVVCTAPLVAPKPLPYHSPTFLQFDLPDDDEDLSHPPYCSRPHKRKRQDTDLDDGADEAAARRTVVVKRRATDDRRIRWHHQHHTGHAVQLRPVPQLQSYSYPMPPPVFAHATYR